MAVLRALAGAVRGWAVPCLGLVAVTVPVPACSSAASSCAAGGLSAEGAPRGRASAAVFSFHTIPWQHH